MQQIYFYIVEHTFKQKAFTADIGEKRTCTYPVCTFQDFLSDSNIHLLLYRKYDIGQLWLICEAYMHIDNVLFVLIV